MTHVAKFLQIWSWAWFIHVGFHGWCHGSLVPFGVRSNDFCRLGLLDLETLGVLPLHSYKHLADKKGERQDVVDLQVDVCNFQTKRFAG